MELKKSILITGASGFVGSALRKELLAKNYHVLSLVRGPVSGSDQIAFLGAEKSNPNDFENLAAIVHLAGDNVAKGRWTKAKKHSIRQSRVGYTNDLLTIIEKLKNPPQQFISASAIGIYGDRGTEELNESAIAGQGFLAQVCVDWEAACKPLEELGIQTAQLRIGMVLGKNGGALEKLKPIFSLGLGGIIGSGKQLMSWITIDDLVAAVIFILENKLVGPFNLTSPNPVTNLEFTKTLGQVLNRPTLLPLPAFAAKLILGDFAKEVLLSSSKVIPERLLQAGFSYKDPHLGSALVRIE